MAITWFKKKRTEEKRNVSDEETTPLEGKEPVSETAAPPAAPPAPPESPAPHTGEPAPPAAPPADGPGFLGRLRKGLSKTREILTTDIDRLFTGKRELDEALLEDLEELLITSDIGVETATVLIDRIARWSRKITGPDRFREAMKKEILEMISESGSADEKSPVMRPHVVMVLGVNGVGKTTTIGKLAAKDRAEGKRVLIAAADTFRAAASEQLTIWAERAGADIIRHRDGADPAAVAFDAIEAAGARNMDVVYVDTAGRLHTKMNLMEELKKIKRTISKKMPDAPHETLLVLDATTGQNALSQARLFHDELGITGLVLTKLDGTAKGGVVIGICSTLKIPLLYIGMGEKIEDLQSFDPGRFVDALF
jgi:fused signal recognition particle receptor